MTKNQNPQIYTGDIVEEHIDPSREYTIENQEIIFSDEQHGIWADLFIGINQPYLLEHICQEFKNGLTLLKLDPSRIPTVVYLNEHITPQPRRHAERKALRSPPAQDSPNR